MAICDIWEYARTYGQRYLKAQGVKVNAYENYEDLLAKEKDLQAVVVATPDFWHAPITNTCLKAGLHVYCEKMMSNTIDGARSMVQDHARDRQAVADRPSAPQQSALSVRAEPAGARRENLRPAHRRAGAMEPRGHGRFRLAETFDMKPEQLAKYGYKDMHQFRNWRWFKGLGGGPLSDLGAHQIDIFNWWLGCTPKSVMASGGLDYYKNHDWYDNAMVIYEFPLPEGVARAFYQVQTTTSAGGGYFEYFMGDEGAIKMSEEPGVCPRFIRKRGRPARTRRIRGTISSQKNYVRAKAVPSAPTDVAKVDVRETAQLAEFEIPVLFNKPPHHAALGEFFQRHPRQGQEVELPRRRGVSPANTSSTRPTRPFPRAKALDITPEETEAIDLMSLNNP